MNQTGALATGRVAAPDILDTVSIVKGLERCLSDGEVMMPWK